MANTRKVEVFSAGCPACDDAVALVKRIACPSCEIEVRNMRDPAVARRAKELGIRTVPSIVVDGEVAGCCRGGPSEEDLRAAGIGQPRS